MYLYVKYIQRVIQTTTEHSTIHPIVQFSHTTTITSDDSNSHGIDNKQRVHFDDMDVDTADSGSNNSNNDNNTYKDSNSGDHKTIGDKTASTSPLNTVLPRTKTGLQLIGIPLTLTIDMSWTCTKLRYVIWEQYVRKYFLKTLIEETCADAGNSQSHTYDINKVKSMLKNIKIQSMIANMLSIRFVNLDGEGMSINYSGPIIPKYAIPPKNYPWSTSMMNTTITPASVQDTTTKPINDDILGDSLPINNIPVHFLLHPKQITVLAIDYHDDISMTSPHAVFSWLHSLDLKEVYL